MTTNADENNLISIKLFLFFKKQRLVTHRETKSEIRILVRNNTNNELIGVTSKVLKGKNSQSSILYTEKIF